MRFALWLGASYLLGAIPTSLIAARLFAGVDLRTVGSRNLGATNLYRALGWRYAVPVGLFDVAKGAVPVLVFGPLASGGGQWGPLFLGVAAVVGHVFSVFVKFRGGKGVATAAGVVLGVAPWATALCAALWTLLVKVSGYVSLASVTAAICLPIAAYWLDPTSRFAVWVLAIIAGFVIVMHRSNISRLIRGTENRFGKRVG